MFIDLNSIEKDMITIDVRTMKEFKEMPLFNYNLELINEIQHRNIKKFYPCAFFVIFRELFRKREYLKSELLKLSDNKKKVLIFGCSRGRLRSPAIYIYAKFIGINCFVLRNGIKRFFEKPQGKRNLFIKIYNYITFK